MKTYSILSTVYVATTETSPDGLYSYTVNNGEVTIVGYVGDVSVKEIIIPEMINGLPVTTIADSVFAFNFTLTKVTIPHNLTIGNRLFYYSTIEIISMPNIEIIQSEDFAFCQSLVSVDLSNATIIGANAFENCVSLPSIKLPNATIISESAFKNAQLLLTVEIPKVTTIQALAFSEDYLLLTLILSKNLCQVGSNAFTNPTTTSITIDYGTEDISKVTLADFDAFVSTIPGINLNFVTNKYVRNNLKTISLLITDTEAPVITLNGPSTITLSIGDAYVEQGATVTDNSGETIEVAITNNVNTNKVGMYSVIYNASDSSGNKAIPVTRNVGVIYQFNGLLKPQTGTSFRVGTAIDVQFQLKKSNGSYITTAIAKLYYARVINNTIGTPVAATSTSSLVRDNTFSYDSSKNSYTFNMKTTGISKGTYVLLVSLDDNQTYNTVQIILK